jgi:hypothetical protein
MPIIPIQRITSSTGNVVSAADRPTAVANLLGGAAANVVNVGNPDEVWPVLLKYNNDNSTFGSSADPQFVWTQSTFIPGESHGFAAQSAAIPLTVGVVNSFVLTLAVFADNAQVAHIDAVNALTLAIIPTTNLGVDLTDGSLNPSTSLTEISPPYNWQGVRYYTIPVTFGLVAAALDVRFVFSFEVVNYDNNGGPFNPAGLAFVADIYQALV